MDDLNYNLSSSSHDCVGDAADDLMLMKRKNQTLFSELMVVEEDNEIVR